MTADAGMADGTQVSGGAGDFSSQANEAGLVLPRPRRVNPWLAAAIVVSIILVSIGVGWVTGGFNPASPRQGITLPASCQTPALQYSGTVSSAVDPASTAVFEQFVSAFDRSTGDCIAISLNTSSGEGGLTLGHTDFLVVGDAPTNSLLAQLPHPVATFPVTVGAIAIAYNLPGLTVPLNLTPGVLSGIFLGTIDNWSSSAVTSINPGDTIGLVGGIHVAFDQGPSSSTDALASYLAATNQTWNATVGAEPSGAWSVGTGFDNASALTQYILATPGSIGYTSIVNLSAAGPAFARVENAAGHFASLNTTGLVSTSNAVSNDYFAQSNLSVDPVLNTASATGAWSYPLTTFSYVVLYRDLGVAYGSTLSWGAAWWLVEFFEWMEQSGGSIPASMGLLAPPFSLTSLAESVIQQVAYNGTSILLGGASSDGEGGGENDSGTGEF